MAATKLKLSPNAQKVFNTFATDEDEYRWVSYREIRDLGPWNLTEICRLWNELRAANAAIGNITTGEKVRVVRV